MAQDQKIVKDDRGQEQPADKKRAKQSAKEGGAAYAPHSEGEARGEKAEMTSAGPGDDRTPDKTIGQIAYAGGQKKEGQGGAGKPETSNLEPEKQGGIGGP